ncbi:metal-dependent hydrolase [Bacillus licheniformis]|nr:metal-dependent hydrolase [Bacillus licheniformis]
MKDARIIPIALPTPFAVGDVNIYLLRGEALTLVDAGPNTKEAAAVLKSELAEQGLSLSDIDQVVLTHHHADHAGLLNEFPAEVKIIGHPFNEPYISQNPDFIEKQKSFFYIPVSTIRRSRRYEAARPYHKSVVPVFM